MNKQDQECGCKNCKNISKSHKMADTGACDNGDVCKVAGVGDCQECETCEKNGIVPKCFVMDAGIIDMMRRLGICPI